MNPLRQSSMTHKVLVVGAGSIGERHARCFASTGRAEVGVVEPLKPRLDTVKSQYGWRCYANINEALNDSKWTTAIICTPANTHIEIATQCLNGGLPVLIEKPLAVDPRQIHTFAQLVKQTSISVGVAYVHRAHPAIAIVHDMLHDGRFGGPLELVAAFGHHFPTARPAYASTYYARHETGGGAIQDALTHAMNTAEWFVGPITRLAVDARHLRLPSVAVEDTVHMIARHGQVMAAYSSCQCQCHSQATITVVCEDGSIRADLIHNRWSWQKDPTGDWIHEDTPLTSRDAWFEIQANAWLDVVEKGVKPACTLIEAWQTLLANVAALDSSRQDGRWNEVHQIFT
ncbi:MAG: Gfo/Idh/MocA family oxidoreductase [Phycisphaeraceae bacterium]|nr:Gfo/Idh/MocA family oxidoreductase [Phycisphaeraceae bacterium]